MTQFADGDQQEIEATFREAADRARRAADVPTATKLDLYALYKQATVGDCREARPYLWDVTGTAKWQAWREQRGLARTEAMVKYVDLVSTSCSTEKGATASSGDPDVGGRRVSSMATVPLEAEEEALDDRTELMVAAAAGALDRVEAAIADAATRDGEGRTALHWAADAGRLEACSLLLAAGAEINATDEAGLTPLAYAVTCDHVEVAQLLMREGADPTIADVDGDTPLKAASAEVRAVLLAGGGQHQAHASN